MICIANEGAVASFMLTVLTEGRKGWPLVWLQCNTVHYILSTKYTINSGCVLFLVPKE